MLISFSFFYACLLVCWSFVFLFFWWKLEILALNVTTLCKSSHLHSRACYYYHLFGYVFSVYLARLFPWSLVPWQSEASDVTPQRQQVGTCIDSPWIPTPRMKVVWDRLSFREFFSDSPGKPLANITQLVSYPTSTNWYLNAELFLTASWSIKCYIIWANWMRASFQE